MKFHFEFFNKPSLEDLNILDQGLRDHALEQTKQSSFHRVALLCRTQPEVILGGISGLINWNWLYVENLWIAETWRHQGLGKQLLQGLESEAKKLGCTWAHLDTFTFQAPLFYEILGYELFAELKDYPPGHSRKFYRKSLV